MIEIRHASPDDVPCMAEMGRDFFTFSRFGEFAHYDIAHGETAIEMLRQTGLALVAVEGETLVGGLLATLSPVWFDPTALVASELAWWIADSHRHTAAGMRLYRAFEEWAVTQGATAVVMSDLVLQEGDMPAAKLYDRMGFALVERMHIKRIP